MTPAEQYFARMRELAEQHREVLTARAQANREVWQRRSLTVSAPQHEGPNGEAWSSVRYHDVWRE